MAIENSQVQAENSINVALLSKAGTGCRSSFSELYRLFHAPLTRFCYRYIQAPDAIEEVVNDTMLAVWNQAKQFRGDSKVSTWIMGIAARKCWQAAKRMKAKAMPEGDNPENLEGEYTLDTIDMQQAVQQAMKQLSDEHRASMELAYHSGYSCEEIAHIMACPVNTVKTRLHYARKALRKIVGATHDGMGYAKSAGDQYDK